MVTEAAGGIGSAVVRRLRAGRWRAVATDLVAAEVDSEKGVIGRRPMAVAFLLGDDAAAITGVSLPVDAGWLAASHGMNFRDLRAGRT